MLVRIRLRRAPAAVRYDFALVIGSFLMPVALLTFTLALCAFEFQWYRGQTLFLQTGFASHWQVWLAVSAALSCIARLLGNYGSDKDAPA